MSTDMRLLELAAKAVGVRLLGTAWSMGSKSEFEGYSVAHRRIWNPLTQDGDALRLAAKLHISIDMTDCDCCVEAYANQLEGDRADVTIRYGADFDDKEADTEEQAIRLAIVRVAAKIGETMQKEKV